MTSLTCLNCKHILTSEINYCPNCGAHQLKNRLGTKEVFKELFDVIFIWNKDFFKTFLHLLISPGKVITFYIKGGRNRYLNPLLYLLFSFFLYLVILSFTGGEPFYLSGMKAMTAGWNESYTEALTEGISNSELENPTGALNIDALNSLDRFSKVLFFLLIPIFAFFSRIFFKSSTLNFAEHIVINAFLLSQIIIINTIFGIPLDILFYPSGKLISSIPAIMIISYLIFCQYQVFNYKLHISLLRSFGFILLSIFSTLLVYMIIALLVGAIL